MEVIVAVGAVASFAQLVEFCLKFVERSREFYGSTHETPKTLRGLLTQLPALIAILKTIESQLKTGEVDQATQEAIIRIIEDCRIEVEGLEKILSRLLPEDADIGWKRGKKIWLSISQGKKIEQIVAAVQRHLQILTSYHQVSILPVLFERQSRISTDDGVFISDTTLENQSTSLALVPAEQEVTFVLESTSLSDEKLQNSQEADDSLFNLDFAEDIDNEATMAIPFLEASNYQCFDSCHYSYHWRWYFRSPELFDRFIGRFQLNCSGLWWREGGCSLASCRTKSTSSQISGQYVFPQWILTRLVSFYFCSSVLGGPVLSIRAPRLVHSAGLMYIYAATSNTNAMQRLISDGIGSPFDVESKKGSTPLHWATINANSEVCRFLIEQGADLDHLDIYGRSPRSLAMEKVLGLGGTVVNINTLYKVFNLGKHWKLVSFSKVNQAVLGLGRESLENVLSESSAILDINKRQHRWTAIEWAATRGDLESVRQLLDHGADTSRIIFCLAQRVGSSHDPALTKILRLALNAGVSLSTVDTNGKIALHSACGYRNYDFIKILLEAGADTTAVTRDGLTPFDLLALRDTEPTLALMQLLLKHGSDPNAQGKYGNTALHLLCLYREQASLTCVKNFVEIGVDPLILNENDEPATFMAIRAGNEEVACYLLGFTLRSDELRSKPWLFLDTFVVLLASKRAAGILRRILSTQKDFHFSYHGATILHIIAIYANLEKLSFFNPVMLKGVDPDPRSAGNCFQYSREETLSAMELAQREQRSPDFLEAFEELLRGIRTERDIIWHRENTETGSASYTNDDQDSETEDFEDTLEEQESGFN